MESKKVLVTGISRGIGKELVDQFLELGHHVFGISRSQHALDGFTEEASNSIGTFTPICVDIQKDDTSEIVARLGTDHLDILINNAGVLINKPFTDITSDEFQNVYDVNVKAPFFLTQALIPHLKKSSMGHVLNVGSMGGVNGTAKFSGLSAYSSSKGSLSILTECLAEEYKESNIHFNCLALGSANTEMLSEAFPGYSAPVSASQMASHILRFSLEGWAFYNGKTLPVSSTTP